MAELPINGAGGLTPMVDLSGAAGAADRVTAANWNKVAGAFGTVSDMLVAHQHTVDAAELSAQRTAWDDDTAELEAAHPYDPEGFKKAATELRSRFVEKTASRYAVPLGQYADQQTQQAHERILRTTVARNQVLAIKGNEARLKSVLSRASDNLREGGGGPEAIATNPGIIADLQEHDSLVDTLVTAKAIAPEEAEVMKADARASLKADAFAGMVAQVNQTEGYEAALHVLGSIYPPAWKPEGMLEPPSLDIHARPVVTNADGSISTVRSITIEADGRHYVIPTVIGDAVVSNEEAVAHFRETGEHLGVFDSQGHADAAARSLHEQQAAEYGPGAQLKPHERDLAFAKASELLERQHAAAGRLRTELDNARIVAKRQISDQIADDIGRTALTGSGNGLTQAAILAAGGDNGDVADWLARKAEALKRNRETGNLALLPPDQAAARIADEQARAGVRLPDALKDEGDFGALWSAIKIAEGGAPGVVSRDPDGAGPAGGGAYGPAQILPATAKRMAEKLGIPFDERRLLNDGAYNEQLGQAYLRELVSRYEGDPFLGVVAYHAGEGNVDAWLTKFGDPRLVGRDAWLAKVRDAGNPRSAAYAGRVAAAMKGGEAWQAWAGQQTSDWANARAGFASDPIDFARQHNVAPVQPLPAIGTPEWGAAVQARRTTGAVISQRYQVPAKMLTNAEAKYLGDQMESDPMAALRLSQGALVALGPKGATDFLREVGQSSRATVQLHIADLAAGGQMAFASTAAQGLVLKAQGDKLPEETTKALDDAFEGVRPSLGAAGAVAVAARQAAEAAYIADRARGVAHPPAYYVNSALGASSRGGVRFGGPAEVNGATTVAPRWLNSDRVDEALQAFAVDWAKQDRGPVYANGKAIPPADVGRMRLVLMPNGRYRLVTKDGRAAMSRRGAAFEVDFEAGRDFLQQRLGAAAVLGAG